MKTYITYNIFSKKSQVIFHKKEKTLDKKPSAPLLLEFHDEFTFRGVGKNSGLEPPLQFAMLLRSSYGRRKKQIYKNRRPQEAFLKTHIDYPISIVTYIFVLVK